MTVLLYLIYGLNVEFFHVFTFSVSVNSITFIDRCHFIIPNEFILIGLLILSISAIKLFTNRMDRLHLWCAYICWVSIFYWYYWSIYFKKINGFGDVKLGLILGGI